MYFRPVFAINTAELEVLPLSIWGGFMRTKIADLQPQLWGLGLFLMVIQCLLFQSQENLGNISHPSQTVFEIQNKTEYLGKHLTHEFPISCGPDPIP